MKFTFDPIINLLVVRWMSYLPPKSSQSGFPPTQPDTVHLSRSRRSTHNLSSWHSCQLGTPLCIMWVVAFAKTMMFSSFLLFSFVFVISADSAEGEMFFIFEHKERLHKLQNFRNTIVSSIEWLFVYQSVLFSAIWVCAWSSVPVYRRQLMLSWTHVSFDQPNNSVFYCVV